MRYSQKVQDDYTDFSDVDLDSEYGYYFED